MWTVIPTCGALVAASQCMPSALVEGESLYEKRALKVLQGFLMPYPLRQLEHFLPSCFPE